MSSSSMAFKQGLLWFYFLINSICGSCAFSLHSSSLEHSIRKTYIVQTLHTSMPTIFTSPANWYTSTLASVIMKGSQFTQESSSSSELDGTSLIYTYRFASQGFAARLTEEEAASLAKVPGFLSVLPDKLFKLQTTYTPEFIGLVPHSGLWPNASFGEDVIVGLLDTGVWPESKSFHDADMPPIPARWKGECIAGIDFDPSLCNKKLIGAKYFFSAAGIMLEQALHNKAKIAEHKSPRDVQGHGTHTASTAAGVPVTNASFFGYANGTAKGIAPKARIAVYKVCWAILGGCLGADLLAAIDEAISDGVDVLSVSLGDQTVPFYEDPLALGAFGALVDHGIFVTCAAGNGGPTPGSVLNTAPWLLTIAATTVDRNFPATVKLGNDDTYVGQSLYTGKRPDAEQLPLVASGLCEEGSLDRLNVEGKIVICQQGTKLRRRSATDVVAAAGGAAEIIVQKERLGRTILASSFLLPSVSVRADEGAAIQKFATLRKGQTKALGNNGRTTAAIFINGTEFGKQRAPVVASFSSRGPNSRTPSILKPDLAMPGVNILAAWSGAAAPTLDPADDRKTAFNIISGTSMSCPHAAGLVALLRAAHPQWSPAAIKSALMTTARSTDSLGKPILDDYNGTPATPFAYGAGHVDPNAALDPGLVYDISVQDYIDFLCELRYTKQELMLFTRGTRECSKQKPGHKSKGTGYDLNYPALSVVFNATLGRSEIMTLRRVVTNVGAASSMYKVEVEQPKGVIVKVMPEKLSFAKEGEKQSFKVVVTSTRETRTNREEEPTIPSSFGFLNWVDSERAHKVRSPIVITWSP